MSFNASDMKVYLVTPGTPDTESLITLTTSSSISFSTATISTTTKDSAGYEEFIMGLRSGTASVEGLIQYNEGAGATNVDQLMTAWMNRTKLRLRFKLSTNAVGSMVITQDAYITSLPLTFNMEEAATFTCEFQLSGAPTVSSVAS